MRRLNLADEDNAKQIYHQTTIRFSDCQYEVRLLFTSKVLKHTQCGEK